MTREIVVSGHFGEWLQGRLGRDGPVALITLPCPALTVRASSGGASPGVFAEDRLRGFLARLGLPAERLPAITCTMPPGAGAGASTATLVAVARWAGFDGAPEDLARACLATEGATDPLMWPAPDRLLWASREGRVVRRMPSPPPCEIVGGFWGAPAATDPADMAFDDMSDLVEDWARAAETADLARLARLASLSCNRCTRLRGSGKDLPGDPMADLRRDLRAAGCVRAHTGSVRGLIFAPGTVPDGWRDALAEAGLTGLLRFRAGTK